MRESLQENIAFIAFMVFLMVVLVIGVIAKNVEDQVILECIQAGNEPAACSEVF